MKKRFFVLVLVFAILLSIGYVGAQETWVKIAQDTFTQAGTLHDCSFGNIIEGPNWFYATCYNQVHRSSDGVNWVQVGEMPYAYDQTRDYLVDLIEVSPGKLIAKDAFKAYISEDAGVTWYEDKLSGCDGSCETFQIGCCYEGDFNGYGAFYGTIIKTSDGKLITVFGGAGGIFGGYPIGVWILDKFGPVGNRIWKWVQMDVVAGGTPWWYSTKNVIMETSDGSFILTGDGTLARMVTSVGGFRDMFVNQFFGEAGYAPFESIIEDSSIPGLFYFAGQTGSDGLVVRYWDSNTDPDTFGGEVLSPSPGLYFTSILEIDGGLYIGGKDFWFGGDFNPYVFKTLDKNPLNWNWIRIDDGLEEASRVGGLLYASDGYLYASTNKGLFRTTPDLTPACIPTGEEICDDLIDNNCDGFTDEVGCIVPCTDVDGDGYGDVGTDLSDCVDIVNEDCDDTEASVNPSATEVPGNSIDDNCDGIVDAVLCEKQNGICKNSEKTWDAVNSTWQDCDYTSVSNYVSDETSPINCDDLDNDCDSFIDEGCGTCDLIDAVWTEEHVYEGTLVSLEVTGGSCDGLEVLFEVWEEDTFPDLWDDSVTLNPTTVSFSGGIASTTWTGEYQSDCFGLCNPPEYYFIATTIPPEPSINPVGATSKVQHSGPGYSLLNVYQYCDDSVLNPGCSGGEICNLDDGVCGIPDCTVNVDCDDSNPGTIDTCNPQGFCKYTLITEPDDGTDGYCPPPQEASYAAGDTDCSCEGLPINGFICGADKLCSTGSWLYEPDRCCEGPCVSPECVWDCTDAKWSDCENGISTRDESLCVAPTDPSCLLITPPNQRACIEEEFPFFTWINVMLVISMLIIFYAFRKKLDI